MVDGVESNQIIFIFIFLRVNQIIFLVVNLGSYSGLRSSFLKYMHIDTMLQPIGVVLHDEIFLDLINIDKKSLIVITNYYDTKKQLT